MIKTFNVLLKIDNSSGVEMRYKTDWYYCGRLATGFSWPRTIGGNDHAEVLNCERDFSIFGCSSYITYTMGTADVTIAFSNPSIGYSKLEVGTGKNIWDRMDSHNYNPFQVFVDTIQKTLKFDCRCTSGFTNICTVNITETG